MSFEQMAFFSTSTQGSRLLEPWCDVIGLPIDKVNFLFAQLVSLPLAFCYRWFFTKPFISNQVRHLALLIPGLVLGFFCFGYQLFNLVALTALTYFFICVCPSNYVQKVVFFTAIIYLSALHLLRQIYDYGSYSIDITGPSMIAIQKITSLGFSLHDGMHRPADSLLDYEKRNAIRRVPSILEYFSYVLQFPTLMSGPMIIYHDYIEFVEGTAFTRHISIEDIKRGKKPSPIFVVLEKLGTSLFFAFCVLQIAPLFPVEMLLDSKFTTKCSLWVIIVYMIVSTTCARFKYFHAWKLGETLTNACGFGFNGFDENKNPKWDLISSVDIINFETATNLRTGLNLWNKTTQNWLRTVAYDRNRRFKTLYTYMLSAVWHGFYPGYYLTFLSGALFTLAGRSLRRHLRPLFIGNRWSHFVYDCLTFAATKFSIGYLVFPFVLLEFHTSLQVYRRIYFIGHIGCLLAIFVLPSVIRLLGLSSSRKVIKPKEE